MKTRFYPVMLAIALVTLTMYAANAQQQAPMGIGKVTTRNNVDLTVTVNAAGVVVLSSPSRSIFLDRRLARTFEDNLAAILGGMKDLEGKDTAVVDFRTLGRLDYGVPNGPTTNGMVFRLELNPTKNDKVLLLMYSTEDREDLILASAGVAQLDDIFNKALKYIDDVGGQSGYVLSVIEKMRTTVAMNNR